MKIILASTSPRRRVLIKRIDPNAHFAKPDVSETLPGGLKAEKIVEYFSRIKASNVAFREQNDAYIIGADTLVMFNHQVLGKPLNAAHAKKMLRSLSGKTHQVITGVTLIAPSGQLRIFHETTAVTFFDLSDNEINAYVNTGEPLDKAGAYGIQGQGALFVKKINGDFYNVVGLPVARLAHELATFMKGTP